MMLAHFNREFNRAKIDLDHTILVAVSGGVDSMVLWHLMHTANKTHGVAHVNFCLRGEESDSDELLVRNQAAEWNIPFHSIRVDTKAYAQQKGISIQMAAREIRYAYFQQLQNEKGYKVLATAHHLQDNIETFLINLNRGTGLKGLAGIRSNKHTFRPLLAFTKQEIKAYAQKYEIHYREDASNQDSKYERNWFRHEIISPWQKRNPNFLAQMKLNFERFNETQTLVNEFLHFKTVEVQKQLNKGKVDLKLLKTLKPQKLLFHHLFAPLGFNQTQLNSLNNCLKLSQVGKQFFSNTHRLTVDRNTLLVSKVEKDFSSEETHFKIEDQSTQETPIPLELKKINAIKFKFSQSKLIEAFDWDKLQFPLHLRKWKEGDRMQPLGMKGMKKISDILIDEKIPLSQKDNIYVLTSGNKIVWLVGIKPDNRFKVTNSTQKITEITTM